MVAVLNKPPTVEEYEGTKPPTVEEYEPQEPQRISVWEPTLKERVKNVISGMVQRSPFVQPGKRLGQLGLRYLSEAVSGLGLYIPDILISKITESDTLASAVDKITGFEPTPREVGAGEAAKFITSLSTIGKILGPAIAKIPAREILRLPLGGGIQFGIRGIIEETSKYLSTDKPIDWEKVHAEAGFGTIFGIADATLGKIAGGLEYRRFIKANPAYKIMPRRNFIKMREAMRAAQQGMGRTQWRKLYGKDVQGFLNTYKKIHYPVRLGLKGAKPTLELAKRPPTAPIVAPAKPVAPITPPEAIVAPEPMPTVRKAEIAPTGFTEAEIINRDYRKLKAKIGVKRARKYFQQVNKLINPNETEIVEYRANGVVVKEGAKYIFKALAGMDTSNWRLSFSRDISEQFVAPEKPVAVPKAEIAPVTPEAVEALQKKYDDKFDVELKKLGLYKVVKEGKAIGLPEVKRQKIRKLKKDLRAEYEKELAQPPTVAKPKAVEIATPQKIKPEQIIRRPEGTIDVDLPPVKEGYIRLYRGQHPTSQKDLFHPKRGILTDEEIKRLGLSKGKGGWFTPWLNYALNYAEAQGEGYEIVYIDVPRTVADAHIAEKAPEGLAERGEAMEYYFPELREVKAPPAKPKAVEKIKPPTVAEYEAPSMATQAQKAQAHIIAKEKAFVSEKGKMRPGYRALAKAMTGQTSIAKMTEQQATDFINALNKLPEPRMKGGRLIPPSIPRTTKLVPKGFFQRRFKRPTPVGLITSNAYYAEKLGVKSLVEPLEKAKMRFDLEHHSASNELDKMGQKIDVLGKTTAKEKITAKVRNIPTKARVEMGDLLDSYEEAPAGLDPKKKEIFDWFRNLTRTMLARQNEARAKLEMPLIKGRKAYMRHIATDISREMLAGKYPFPEGIGFWSGLNTGKKIFNPMEFQRKLEEDIYGLFTRDPVYASKAMMYNALKEIHLNQPLKFFNEQLSALGKDLPEYKNLSPRERAELDKTSVIPADTRRWLIDYVNNVIKGQQTNTDRLVNNIVNESGLRGLLNTALRPYGRVLSQRPVTKFFQAAGRVQMAGVMGTRPRLIIRNKFQLTQNLALYGTKANVRAFLPPNKELKKLLDESLFLKSYTGLEELPADLTKKVEKLWHKAYQWSATSNARQAMEVAYWDIKELINNPKYAKYGWKPEHLLKEMEFGAAATQYQYNAIGMPGIFRHKSLIPATRLTSWWMNYFAKFHREAVHRAFTGRPSWSGPDGPTLPWSRRLGWLRYAIIGGLILDTMGYWRSYMFGAAPTGWPPALQAVSALYRYTIAEDDAKRKAAKARFYNAAKTFIPGYIAYKDFNAVWTGRKDLESLFFYKKRKKAKGD